MKQEAHWLKTMGSSLTDCGEISRNSHKKYTHIPILLIIIVIKRD